MWEKINKIEELDVQEAIDVEVNGNHLFYANSILTHNSNSDVGLEDTSESFGLPATADLMFALISNEELEAVNQIAVKQLKNRYNDVNVNKRFVIGIDRSKMRLMDLDESQQSGLADSNQTEEKDDFDTPTFDKTAFGTGWQV